MTETQTATVSLGEEVCVESRPEPCGVEPPEACERLLLDCVLGDQTLFVRTDGMESGWSRLPADGRARRMP